MVADVELESEQRAVAVQVSQQGSFTFGWQLREHLPLAQLLQQQGHISSKPGAEPSTQQQPALEAELKDLLRHTAAASSFAISYSPPRPSAGEPGMPCPTLRLKSSPGCTPAWG